MRTSVLQELSNRFNGKLSKCEIYDANICTTRSTADRPWELIPVSGEPFSRRLKFSYKSRKLTLLESSAYFSGTVKGTFASRPLSINKKLKAGFRSEYVSSLTVGDNCYPVFSETGKLSQDQHGLLNRSELANLLKESNLQEGEGLYFTKGEIGFYLKQTTPDRLSNLIEKMTDLAAKVEVPEDKLNLKVLPIQFHPLIPLIGKWGLTDDSDRDDLLSATTKSILQVLVEEVEPYLVAIDSYLDSFREGSPTEQAVALGRLAECALEAKQYLGHKK